MRHIIIIILLFAVAANVYAGENLKTESNAATEDVVFRAPFTLKLHVDKEHYYEASFGKIPYVHDNNIYLFCGEYFGVDVEIRDDEIVKVRYQKDPEKADVALRFTQEMREDGSQMTMLTIQSRLRQRLYIDGMMTIPKKKGIYKTSILPVEPGLTGYEGWPHPIVQLVLNNLRLNE